MQIHYWILLGILVVVIGLRMRAVGTFRKYTGVMLTGVPPVRQAVQELLDETGMERVNIEAAKGIEYSDTFMPHVRTLLINESTAQSRLALAICTGLHATGRAIRIINSRFIHLIKQHMFPWLRALTIFVIPLALIGWILNVHILIDIAAWLMIGIFVLSWWNFLIERSFSKYGKKYLLARVKAEHHKMIRRIYTSIDLTYWSMVVSGVFSPVTFLFRLIFGKRG